MLMDSTDAELQEKKALCAISLNIWDFTRIAMLMRLKLGFRYSNVKILRSAKFILEEVGGSGVHCGGSRAFRPLC